MLTVLSGADHRDPYALPPEDQDYLAGLEEGVRGWRIAYSPTLGYAKVDAEIAASAAEAARHFEALGAIVEQVDAIFASPRDALFTLWAAGTAKLLAGFPADRRDVIDPGLVATAEEGERISAVDYLGADLVRNTLARQMAEFHRNIRSAADADDAGPGLAGRTGSERSRDRAALDRLVAVQLSVQPDPPAGSQHSLRPDPRVGCRSACRSSARYTPMTASCAPPAPSKMTQPERRPPLEL